MLKYKDIIKNNIQSAFIKYLFDLIGLEKNWRDEFDNLFSNKFLKLTVVVFFHFFEFFFWNLSFYIILIIENEMYFSKITNIYFRFISEFI